MLPKKKITKEEFKRIVDKINRQKPNVFVWDEAKENGFQSPAQYSLPQIKFVGDATPEMREEAHDAVISYLVDKHFKDYDCHVLRFKGKTYIRMKKKPKKHKHEVDAINATTAMPYVHIPDYIYKNPDVLLDKSTIAGQYSRKNTNRYRKGKK